MSITHLKPHSKLTVDEAVAVAMRQDLTDILIIGYNTGNDLVVACSEMTNEQSVMMAELFKHKTLNEF